MKFLNHLQLNYNELQNATLHKATTAGAPSSPTAGTIFYNTSLDLPKWYDGSAWRDFGYGISYFTLTADSGVNQAIDSGNTVDIAGGTGITTAVSATDTVTVNLDAAQTGITSIYATDLIIGEDSGTAVDFGTPDEIDFKANGLRMTLSASALYPTTTNQIDLGTASLEFKDAFFDGTVTSDAFAGPLTGDVTGDVTGNLTGNADSADTATTATQSNALKVTDNESTNENNLITFVADAGDTTGYHSVEMDGNLYYNPSTGTLTATTFVGNITGDMTGDITGNLIIGGHTVDDIDIGSEFVDADDHLMSSGAIKEKIESYGYSTTDVSVSTDNLETTLALIDTNYTIGSGTSIDGTISGDLTITGDLIVSGATTTVNTATLTVEDPLIKLASGNTSGDVVDIGFYGLYDTSGSQDVYTGLTRDATDDKWHLWKLNQAEPTTTVNHSGTGFAVDTLVANLEGDVTGNADTATNLTASTGTTVALGTIELGHATDTTIARSGSGDITIEGKAVYRADGTDVPVADGGTGASTASAAFTALKQAASTSATGVVELATSAEVLAGSGAGKVVDATQIAQQRMCVATIDTSDGTWATNLQAEITHDFGTYDVMVEVYDMTSDTQETVHCNVTRAQRDGTDDNNKVLIEVSEAHAGGTLRVLITSLKGAATGSVSYATS